MAKRPRGRGKSSSSMRDTPIHPKQSARSPPMTGGSMAGSSTEVLLMKNPLVSIDELNINETVPCGAKDSMPKEDLLCKEPLMSIDESKINGTVTVSPKPSPEKSSPSWAAMVDEEDQCLLKSSQGMGDAGASGELPQDQIEMNEVGAWNKLPQEQLNTDEELGQEQLQEQLGTAAGTTRTKQGTLLFELE